MHLILSFFKKKKKILGIFFSFVSSSQVVCYLQFLLLKFYVPPQTLPCMQCRAYFIVYLNTITIFMKSTNYEGHHYIIFCILLLFLKYIWSLLLFVLKRHVFVPSTWMRGHVSTESIKIWRYWGLIKTWYRSMQLFSCRMYWHAKQCFTKQG
jgi:hypothetical protein